MSRRPPPSRAIEARKALAEGNRRRISDAVVALQRAGLDVNVRSVAREAGVSVDTVRRSGDLYTEIRSLRDAAWSAGTSRAPSRQSERETALLGRLTQAQQEVVALRARLKATERAMIQRLGTTSAGLDPDEAARLKQENAELRVLAIDLEDKLTTARGQLEDLTAELTEAHELNREYVRQATALREQLNEKEQQLSRARRGRA